MSDSLDQFHMRRSNLALVLGELIADPRTRAQLATDIDMTRGAVGSLVNDLIARRLVRTASDRPQPPQRLLLYRRVCASAIHPRCYRRPAKPA